MAHPLPPSREITAEYLAYANHHYAVADGVFDVRVSRWSNSYLEVAPPVQRLFRDCDPQPAELLLGEFDFSYTEARLISSPTDQLVATEYLSKEAVLWRMNKQQSPYTNMFDARRKKIIKQGCRVMFGVDATLLHIEHRLHSFFRRFIGALRLSRWSRVRFNMPYATYGDPSEKLLVRDFFRSVWWVQEPGDEVRMLLPESDNPYDVRTAAAAAGYRVMSITNSPELPGYTHHATHGKFLGDTSNEWVFQKLSFDELDPLPLD